MESPKILIIQNCEAEGFGRYERYIADNFSHYDIIHPYQKDTFPNPEECGAALIGGSPLSANDIDKYPFLQHEVKFLEQVIKSGKPCLGICFGAQILARVLGAPVRECRPKEIGGYEVKLTDGGRKDPILGGFPEKFPVFQWHGDTFDIPDGAKLLAEGDTCRNQAFRLYNAIGVQFHLETGCEEAGRWADAYSKELAEFGKSKEQVLAECRERESERLRLAKQLMKNLFENLI